MVTKKYTICFSDSEMKQILNKKSEYIQKCYDDISTNSFLKKVILNGVDN